MASSAQGLDTSDWQGNFIWSETKGLTFGIARATQGLGGAGTGSPDPDLAWNWDQISAKGLHRGGYHFLNPELDGKQQAQYFVATLQVRGLKSADMLWLDHETAGSSPAADARCAQEFMTELVKLCPHNPRGVYTFIDFAKEGHCAGLGGYPLWLAYPSSTAPKAPEPWSHWTLWQWGVVNGIDHDAFNGSSAQFAAWVKSFVPVKPPVKPDKPTMVTADGKTSWRELAHNYGTTLERSVWLTASAMTGGFGPAECAYFGNGDFDAIADAGMNIWVG